ncbi:MAG: hypothetical protein WDA16_13050 [Candidatus Thermoplasmatota archaeon]
MRLSLSVHEKVQVENGCGTHALDGEFDVLSDELGVLGDAVQNVLSAKLLSRHVPVPETFVGSDALRHETWPKHDVVAMPHDALMLTPRPTAPIRTTSPALHEKVQEERPLG